MEDEPSSPPVSTSSTAASVPIWQIETLLASGKEAVILHDGQAYRLRITSNRKLILTK